MIDIGIDRPGHSTRLLVQQALGLYKPEALIHFLSDRDAIVRTAAARELQQRGGELALDEAKRLSLSRRGVDREIAAFLLGQLGTPKRPFRRQSLPVLSSLLFDKSAAVREAAAAALGHLRFRAAVSVLIDASADPIAGVRSAVAFALTQFPGDELAQRCLLVLSKDRDKEVRLWANAK